MKQKSEYNKIPFFKREDVSSVLSALICIVIGFVIGFIVLLIISPGEAGRAIVTIIQNFFYFPRGEVALEYFGNTLVKTAPLLMCTLSVIFAKKVGLFNIGVSGQYTVGAGLSLYCALALGMPWYICMIAAVLGGALIGAAIGALKIYFNVNEVISGIMLNWISLYSINMLLTRVKETSTPFTVQLEHNVDSALLPAIGLKRLFSGNQYVTIAIILSLIAAVAVWFIYKKTVLGYELKATGLNINAARYAGMKEKRNIILTMAIAGGLAALGAVFMFLSGIEQWDCGKIAVPQIGFNGIAAAFLGGVNPIGAIFSSYFIQHITSGGAYINRMVFSTKISDMMIAIIIYTCSFGFFIRHIIQKMRGKRQGTRDEGGKKTATACSFPDRADEPVSESDAQMRGGKKTGTVCCVSESVKETDVLKKALSDFDQQLVTSNLKSETEKAEVSKQ